MFILSANRVRVEVKAKTFYPTFPQFDAKQFRK
jgi:hypothetical protein